VLEDTQPVLFIIPKLMGKNSRARYLQAGYKKAKLGMAGQAWYDAIA
jgi:hypothetical protein